MEKHIIDRIEDLTDQSINSILKHGINNTIVDILNEGWEYSDARQYLLHIIDETIVAHKRQDELDKISSLIGRQCVVVDEMGKKNNVKIHTISGIGDNGGICFQGYDGETHFAFDNDLELFTEGYKAYIHPEEVSIQLISKFY